MLEADVCIVGCGLTGLVAAWTILANASTDVSVVMVDGRNRPGGRTNTISLADSGFPVPVPSLVDVGGQWIGSDHSRMLDLVRYYNLELEDQFYPDDKTKESSYSLGNLVSMISYNFPLLSNEEESEVNTFVSWVDELGLKMSLDQPWLFANAHILDVSVFDYVIQKVTLPRAQKEIFTFIQTILACDPADVSFLFFVYYIASGGGMRALGDGVHGAQKWKLKRGAQVVSDCLLASISSSQSERNARVIMSSRVTDIAMESLDTGIVIVSTQSTASDSGSTSSPSVRCKRVLLAMSPRLAVSSIQYSPPLPPHKAALAEHMIAGSVVKVICVFDDPFWLHANTDAVGSCSLPSLYPVHNFFHATVEGRPALVGLITGDAAKKHTLLSPEKRQEDVMNEIHLLFAPESQSPPNPIAYIEKDWTNEEFSGGCFACLFRSHSFVEHGPHLKTPLTAQTWSSNKISDISDEKPVMYFASTETAPLFSGYMEGAVLAGEAVAYDILKSLIPN